MAKKLKKNNPKPSSKNGWLLAGAAVIVGGAIWWAVASMGSDPTAGLRMPAFETLDPAQFAGKVRDAYQAAKDVPEVLAQVPCYCGCAQNFGHESNLFCFRDDHGVGCDMCQSIAIEARNLYRQGKTVGSIRDEIRMKYSAYAP